MISTLKFFAHGDPKGQPRPRAFAFHGKARVFDPGTAEGWKGQVAIAAKDAWDGRPFTQAVVVRLTFVMRRPKGHFRSNGELKPAAPYYHTGKPDVDNLAKAVLDALTTLGMWRDDAIVYEMHVLRCYEGTTGTDGTAHSSPGCWVTVFQTPEATMPWKKTVPDEDGRAKILTTATVTGRKNENQAL